MISGRVQGVGFRFFSVRQARIRDLVGWTRNLPDGQVEVVVEGPEAVLEDFRTVLCQGPPASRVDSLRDETLVATGSFVAFDVRG